MEGLRLMKFHVRGIGHLLYGKKIYEQTRENEGANQFEDRTWKKRCHSNGNGGLTFPSSALHKSLISAGKWRKEKIPGAGTKTYTQRIVAGVTLVALEFKLLKSDGSQYMLDDVEKYTLSVPHDGTPGGRKRVDRHFPRLSPGWNFYAEYIVLDEILTDDVLQRHAKSAGLFNGLGAMRIGNGGPNGMFAVEEFKMEPYDTDF